MDGSTIEFAPTMYAEPPAFSAVKPTNDREHNMNGLSDKTIASQNDYGSGIEDDAFFETEDTLREGQETLVGGDGNVMLETSHNLVESDGAFLRGIYEAANYAEQTDAKDIAEELKRNYNQPVDQNSDSRNEDFTHEFDKLIDPNDHSSTTVGFHADEHEKFCNKDRGFTTPPPPAIVNSDALAKSTTGQIPINSEKDLCKDYKDHEDFHARAKNLVPRIHLDAHRYWIGVLEFGKKPSKISKEKDFTWMKGSRVTTVETVLRSHPEYLARQNIVLLHWRHRVDLDTKMEELNDFNDRFVFFQVVSDNHERAKGREIGWGWLPGERGADDPKGVTTNLSEPIVIDDDED